MKRLVVLVAAMLAALSACGNTTDADRPLVVYSGRSEELVAPLIEMFKAESGLEVQLRYQGSTELAATLLAEGESSDADVYFAQDPASLGAVVELLETLDEDMRKMVPDRFQDEQGRWVGTSGRVRTFVHGTGFTPLPQTIDDVVNGFLDGTIGIAPTNGSFLAFVAAMVLDRGEVATADWLEQLASREPVDFPNNSSIVAAVDSGEIDAGLVNHYYLLRLRAEGGGQNAENWFIPEDDPGSLVMPAGVGILKTSDNQEAAKTFVEFLLSNEAQTFFAENTFEYPLAIGVDVDLPSGLPNIDEIGPSDIDMSALAGALEVATRLVAEAGLV